MGTDELLDAVRRYAMERFPRASTIEVSIIVPQGDGAKFCVPVYTGRATSPPAPDAVEKVYPNERRILEAVSGMEEENPTAAEIAEAAGLTDYPHLRKLLLAMRRNGRLGGKAGADAYPITAKGRASIESAS